MPDGKGPYRAGQRVRVTYEARVAEVSAGDSATNTPILLRLETEVGTTGWVNPDKEFLSVTILSQPLPTEPGLYGFQGDASWNDQSGGYHTDGWQFYYLNTQKNWVDIGWGAPYVEQAEALVLFQRPPF